MKRTAASIFHFVITEMVHDKNYGCVVLLLEVLLELLPELRLLHLLHHVRVDTRGREAPSSLITSSIQISRRRTYRTCTLLLACLPAYLLRRPNLPKTASLLPETANLLPKNCQQALKSCQDAAPDLPRNCSRPHFCMILLDLGIDAAKKLTFRKHCTNHFFL